MYWCACLWQASCTLDAGVVIYSKRVDSVHNETFKFLCGLSRTAVDGESTNGGEGKKQLKNSLAWVTQLRENTLHCLIIALYYRPLPSDSPVRDRATCCGCPTHHITRTDTRKNKLVQKVCCMLRSNLGSTMPTIPIHHHILGPHMASSSRLMRLLHGTIFTRGSPMQTLKPNAHTSLPHPIVMITQQNT